MSFELGHDRFLVLELTYEYGVVGGIGQCVGLAAGASQVIELSGGSREPALDLLEFVREFLLIGY